MPALRIEDKYLSSEHEKFIFKLRLSQLKVLINLDLINSRKMVLKDFSGMEVRSQMTIRLKVIIKVEDNVGYVDA